MTSTNPHLTPRTPTDQRITRLWQLAGAAFRLARIVDTAAPSAARVQMAAARIMAARALAHRIIADHPEVAAHETTPSAVSLLHDAAARVNPQSVALLILAHDARTAITPDLPVTTQLTLEDLAWDARGYARTPGYQGIDRDTPRARALLDRLTRRATEYGLAIPPGIAAAADRTTPTRPRRPRPA